MEIERERNLILEDNKRYAKAELDEGSLTEIKKEEEERIDDIFFDMMKMTKILYESG